MITEKRLNTVEEVLKELLTQDYEEDKKRYRSDYMYRGLPNSKFKLVTSLERNCGDKRTLLEKPLLRNFTKYALYENENLKDSIWNQLALGQHHGLPTRMLDWTYSSLMGLNFAMTEYSFDDFDKHDCVVWAINIKEINSLLPKKYKDKLQKENAFLFTIDMLEDDHIELEDYDKAMKEVDGAMVLLEPPSIDQRIINQYSYFSIIPNCISDIEGFLNEKTNKTIKYIINKDIRWELRDLLDTLNINERIVYPGLDGVATWLKRHYYVKK